jgi:hypothetical protein
MEANFETGAKTHAVNDLILFTDTTEKLCLIRDSIFKDWFDHGTYNENPPKYRFSVLFQAAKAQYIKEFPTSSSHIKNMTQNEIADFYGLYELDYEEWKEENYGLRSIEVTYSNGDVIPTAMAHGLTDDQMLDYFAIGKSFNLGRVEDDMQTVVSRKITK